MPEKRYRADATRWEVVEVDCPHGTEYPKADSEGFVIYSNTHFVTRAAALESLQAESRAMVRLRGAEVEACRKRLLDAEHKAADAAAIFAKVHEMS